MDNPAITTRGLTRRFGRMTAVSDIDLNVARGSIYGFLGPNGAGKTTTIRLLLGLLKPDAGEIELLGLAQPANRMESMSKTGALVERPSCYPHLSGRENLEITRSMRQLDATESAKALAIVGLEESADRKVGTYSLGMRQRLALALAMLGSPELLILDEPSNGLDPAGIREMRDLIRELPKRWGVTVFLSSHLLAEIEQVATHLGIVHEGRLVFQGSIGEFESSQTKQCVLETNQPDATKQLVAGWGYTAASDTEGRLLISGLEASDAATLNARLVGKGIGVHHLAERRSTLEDRYLAVTKSEEAVL